MELHIVFSELKLTVSKKKDCLKKTLAIQVNKQKKNGTYTLIIHLTQDILTFLLRLNLLA
jgi:hypothetical protein